MSPEVDALTLRYAWLDRLPERLFSPVVTHTHGELAARGQAILTMREALLSGRIPAATDLPWPDPALRDTLCQALESSNVASYCRADPQITGDILLFVLDSVGQADNLFDRALVAFHTLARKDEQDGPPCSSGKGECDSPGDDGPGGMGRRGLRRGVTPEDWQRLQREALALSCELLKSRAREWRERVEIFVVLEGIFEQLAAKVSLPPGLGRGMLRALPRDSLLQMRDYLGHLPALEDLIRMLGRMQESDDPEAPSVMEQLGQCVKRVTEQTEHMFREPAGIELRGVERSGDVARMLPSEAVLLTHPTLRMLWRARWVERSLLAYHAPGVLTKRVQEKQSFEDGEERQQLRADRGPILAILDTSGSMAGVAETVAKAVLVQIVGLAFLENRPCYVYNFSGEGDLDEEQLSFDGDGLPRMLSLIGASFGGGTEIAEVLRQACARVQEKRWSQADIVILSDGDFHVERATLSHVGDARQNHALRIHGIRFGSGRGFQALGCDTIHNVCGWLVP